MMSLFFWSIMIFVGIKLILKLYEVKPHPDLLAIAEKRELEEFIEEQIQEQIQDKNNWNNWK